MRMNNSDNSDDDNGDGDDVYPAIKSKFTII